MRPLIIRADRPGGRLAAATAPTTVLISWLLAAGGAMAACQVDTREVAFGVVDLARGSETTGEIALACDLPTGFAVAIDGSGVPGARFMTGPGGATLTYDLYPDATFAVPWANAAGSGQPATGTSDGNGTTRLTVYGRVPIQAGVAPGIYGDSLVVTVSFF